MELELEGKKRKASWC